MPLLLCQLGNSKGFRSSAPKKGNEDEIPISYYKSQFHSEKGPRQSHFLKFHVYRKMKK